MTEDPFLSELITNDPNSLFEKYNKDEIERVHSKLSSEIEKKKEELRTMVGWVFIFFILILSPNQLIGSGVFLAFLFHRTTG